ncbi:undecaprenyl-diphosphate phosphatase [Elongatibacter sediminis]|uniref:Undecaprenyl-diphosphatase n=1 Tax=Elongatibacter sediminis TaxID=3119006 RepID=A0AAW9RBP6_9GAMM
MPLLHIVVLALIQGLTEFLPVSSSAHLILGSRVFGWPDQGLVFDVATHLGTLLAVLFYFRRELAAMLAAVLRPVTDEAGRANRALVGWLAIASVPALAAGALAHDLVEFYLRDVRVIAVTTLLFGGVLWWADRVGATSREVRDVDWRAAVVIGLAQALALVPGVSRSGVTITAGRYLGFGPEAAARFSFLLAIPIIAAAGAYGALKVAAHQAPIDWSGFGLAVGFAALAGWVCIAAFLALLRRVGLVPFVIYRLCLGAVLLWLVI